MCLLSYRKCDETTLDSCGWISYFASVSRIAAKNYTPTDEDLLRLYCPTKGLKHLAEQLGRYSFRAVEVGNVISVNRNKWIHQFDNSSNILFVAPIADYDHGSANGSMSRLQQSLDMFKSIATSPWFSRVPIILLFTQMDLLEEKLQSIPLQWFHPTYSGEIDRKAAAAFIVDLFTKNIPDSWSVYVYYSNALDTLNMRFFFGAFNGRSVVTCNKQGAMRGKTCADPIADILIPSYPHMASV